MKSFFSHILLTCTFVGVSTVTHASAKQVLTIDNDGNKFLTLSVNGAEKGMVLPGRDVTFPVSSGDVSLKLVDRKGKVVFSGNKKFAADKSYLFSLNGKNQYVISSQHYSASRGGGLYQKKSISRKQGLTDSHWIAYNSSYYAPNQAFPRSVVIEATSRSATRWGMRIQYKFYYKAASMSDLKFYYENDTFWDPGAFTSRYQFAKKYRKEACDFLVSQVELGYKKGLAKFISRELGKIPPSYQRKISDACGVDKKWKNLKTNIIATSANSMEAAEFIKLYAQVDDVMIPQLNSILRLKHSQHLDGMLKHKKLRPVDYEDFRKLYAKDKVRLGKVMQLVKVSSLQSTDLESYVVDLLAQPNDQEWVQKAIEDYRGLGKHSEELDVVLHILVNDVESSKKLITEARSDKGFNDRRFMAYAFGGPVYDEKKLASLLLLFRRDEYSSVAAHILSNRGYSKRVDVKKWLLKVLRSSGLADNYKELFENHPAVLASYLNGLKKEELKKLDYAFLHLFRPLNIETFKPLAAKLKSPMAKYWVYEKAFSANFDTDLKTMQLKLYLASPEQRFTAVKSYLSKKRIKSKAAAMKDPVMVYAYKVAGKHRKLYDDMFGVEKFSSPGYLKEPEKKKLLSEAKVALKSSNPELVTAAAKFLSRYSAAEDKKKVGKLLLQCAASRRTPFSSKIAILDKLAIEADEMWLKTVNQLYKSCKNTKHRLSAYRVFRSGVSSNAIRNKVLARKVAKRMDAIHAEEGDEIVKEKLEGILRGIKTYRRHFEDTDAN